MSTLFEGIACRASPTDLLSTARVVRPSGPAVRWPSLDARPVAGDVSVAYANNPRADGVFPEELAAIAAVASERFGNALHVMYNDRTGFRYSGVYVSGELRREFDEADELWVRLDDDGKPLKDGPRFRADELEDDEEYETVANAIQHGLAEAGLPDLWPELLRVIGTQ